MKYLLDTHILLWLLLDDDMLPAEARKAIADPGHEIYYSVISLWEIET